MKKLFLLIAILIAAPALAQGTLPAAPFADKPLDDPRKEEVARDLMDELRCVKCQSQSIADSHAPIAGDMRSQVRERILAGDSPEQVRTWLIERYGDWVSYSPPVNSVTWPLWAAPIFLLIIALLIARTRFSGAKGDK